jgi:PPK2 family polyphosphate:nucleotide phosphotransferase
VTPADVLRARELIDALLVVPGERPGLRERDPGGTFGLLKETGKQRLDDLHARLDMLQQRLYAQSRRSVLVVIQGMDGSGKDGVIRRVFSGLNPQGCRVAAFKVPTTTELAHDYLWRVHALTPACGEIGVFNRSHYEDVVTVRIRELAPEEVWRRRSGHIRDWERLLVDEGTEIVKVFLNVSRDEQRRRFQERVDDPEKRWKFRLEDIDVRRSFDDYLDAYEDAIAETSTDWAPWYVVPADRNWLKALAVAELLSATLERMDPQLPEPDPAIEGLRIE